MLRRRGERTAGGRKELFMWFSAWPISFVSSTLQYCPVLHRSSAQLDRSLSGHPLTGSKGTGHAAVRLRLTLFSSFHSGIYWQERGKERTL